MEGDLHAHLKRCTRAWLQAAGAAAVAHEVTTPIPHWRADAAAWFRGALQRLDALPALSKAQVNTVIGTASNRPEEGTLPWTTARETALQRLLIDAGAVDLFGQPDPDPPAALRRAAMRGVRTVIVECKASRADFLSDRAELEQAGREHARLRARRDRIREQLLARWEPHLRRIGETLFTETDGWNFGDSRLASVRQVERDERLAAEALRSQVKFSRMAKWRLADRLYLCAPGGLLKVTETPRGWGLLEVTRGALRVRVPAPDLDCPEPRRWRAVTCVQRRLEREVD